MMALLFYIIVLALIVSYFVFRKRWVSITPRKSVNSKISHLNVGIRRQRRMAIRILLRENGIKRPRYFSAKALLMWWLDCKQLLIEELMRIRKGQNG